MGSDHDRSAGISCRSSSDASRFALGAAPERPAERRTDRCVRSAAGFLDQLRRCRQPAVAANLVALGSSSPDIQQAAIDAVKATVNQQVNDAIDGKLSLAFKLEVKADLKTPDKVIDSAFHHFAVAEAASASTLSLQFGAGTGHDYQLDGTFTVTADPCEAELIRIRAAQQAIANTEGALKKLFGHEGPGTEKQIELLEEELSTQQSRLAAAEADLSQCRASTSATPGS